MANGAVLKTLTAGSLPVEIVADSTAISRRAAEVFLACVRAQPEAVLCLATGASPTGLYEQLAREAARDSRTFSGVRVVKLDEWLGLPMSHPSTCEAYLQERFLQPCRIPPDRYLAFCSDTADAPAECRRIAAGLQDWGGIDLAVLGLGINGHLGLNEPGDSQPGPHVVDLAADTTEHAMLKQHGAVVTRGMTLGVGDLLAARQGLLLVSGERKRDVLQSLLRGAPTDRFPAAVLRNHPRYLCICDRAAAGV